MLNIGLIPGMLKSRDQFLMVSVSGFEACGLGLCLEGPVSVSTLKHYILHSSHFSTCWTNIFPDWFDNETQQK